MKMSEYCKISYLDNTDKLAPSNQVKYILGVTGAKALIKTWKFLTVKELEEELTLEMIMF